MSGSVQDREGLRGKRFSSDYFIAVDKGTVIVTNRRTMEPDFFKELVEGLAEYGVHLSVEVHDPEREDWP